MAGQQVAPESALPFFRQRCSELQDETLLLRARAAELEQEITALAQAKEDAEQRAAAAEQRQSETQQLASDVQQQLAESRAENEQLRARPPSGPAQPLSCVEDALP
ncbi:hypothetical protein [Streptomyces sp. 1222.5]|uniref:hypothetical protein n=1 Tax=Streptomyces sp. 1222.5 TaxID=1881026 RepID=UPI003EB7187E